MATLTSKTVGINTAVSLNYKWDSYFNAGDWSGTASESSNVNFTDIIWYDNGSGVLTKTKPATITSDFPICAVTLHSYNAVGLGTSFKLFSGNSEVIDKGVVQLDASNQIYLVREGTILFIVKILKTNCIFSSPYTNIALSAFTFTNTTTNATKVLTVSAINRNGSVSLTSVKIRKSTGTEDLILALPNDPDGVDYSVPTTEITFTDFT